jgi:hypothetical protein
MPPVQVQLPLIEIAIDETQYRQDEPGRKITLWLLGPLSHTFKDKRADEFAIWFTASRAAARFT